MKGTCESCQRWAQETEYMGACFYSKPKWFWSCEKKEWIDVSSCSVKRTSRNYSGCEDWAATEETP